MPKITAGKGREIEKQRGRLDLLRGKVFVESVLGRGARSRLVPLAWNIMVDWIFRTSDPCMLTLSVNSNPLHTPHSALPWQTWGKFGPLESLAFYSNKNPSLPWPLHSVNQACSLGFIFQATFSFFPHLQSIAKSSSFLISNIIKLHSVISGSFGEIPVSHSSKPALDFYNSLFLVFHYHTQDSSFYSQLCCQNHLPRCSGYVMSLFISHHYFPVCSCIQHKCLALMLKTTHSLPNPCLSSVISHQVTAQWW